jgi:nitrogen fixation NifU-like protein
MDHIKNARNYFVLDDVNRTASGSNPLCGDELTVSLKIEHDRIEKIAFQCTCCGISMASASIMTEMIKGKDVNEARPRLRSFIAILKDRMDSSPHDIVPEQLALLETVRKFPTRKGCAVLPWATLEGALDSPQETIFAR